AILRARLRRLVRRARAVAAGRRPHRVATVNRARVPRLARLANAVTAERVGHLAAVLRAQLPRLAFVAGAVTAPARERVRALPLQVVALAPLAHVPRPELLVAVGIRVARDEVRLAAR